MERAPTISLHEAAKPSNPQNDFKVDIASGRQVARISIMLAEDKSRMLLNAKEVQLAITNHLHLKTHHNDLENLHHTVAENLRGGGGGA